ncbi:MAG: sugar ABC transporter permease, partial [Clostridia bacterium]
MDAKTQKNNYVVWSEEQKKYILPPEQVVRDDVERHHWKQVLSNLLKDWRLYLMLVPMILVFFFWRYMPMYELLGCFKYFDTSKAVAEQYFIGFGSFQDLLFGGYAKEFWRAFRNTFMLSFYGLCFGFPAPIILALFFNEIKSNIARSVYQVCTYLPKFMSTVVITTLVTLLLQGKGVINEPGIISQLFVKIGLITPEVSNFGMMNNP